MRNYVRRLLHFFVCYPPANGCSRCRKRPLMAPLPCPSMSSSRCRKQSLRPPVAFVVAEVKGLVLDAHVLAGKCPWFAQPTHIEGNYRPNRHSR